jgi:hypothetical protein
VWQQCFGQCAVGPVLSERLSGCCSRACRQPAVTVMACARVPSARVPSTFTVDRCLEILSPEILRSPSRSP